MGERDGQQARATEHEQEPTLQPQQHGVAAKPASSAQANHMVASLVGQRVTPPAKAEHDFGEHIVGSDNNVEHIHAPWNLSETPATAAFSVSGEAFQLLSTNVMALQPSSRLHGDDLTYAERASPKIAFRPRRAGEFQGTLTIKISWPMDGHVETQTISLRGRARELTEAPVHFCPDSAPPATATHHEPSPDAPTKDASARDVATKGDVEKAIQNKDAVDGAVREAASAASNLADDQQEGLRIVEAEAATYSKKMAALKRSRWWDLAEMALNVATGSLAGAFATRVLPRLLGGKETLEIPMLGTIEETYSAKLSENLTGTIKAALITAGTKAIKLALPPETPQAEPATEQEDSGGRFSSNARIDFFAQQRTVLREQKNQYDEQINAQVKHIRPLIVGHPQQAIHALSVVKAHFAELKQDAIQSQIDAVAPAWATLVARLGLGQEVTTTAPGEHGATSRQATSMDALRASDERGTPAASTSGVLDVWISSGKVVGARLNGVAQEIADHLKNMPLAQVAMPIRFIMGQPGEPRPTILTRDEAGRVRVQGELSGQTNEHESVRTASEMIERVLGRTLASMHIEIQTDDATGRRP